MESEPNNKLETVIQQELRRLPELSAPATLIPRVMSAIHARVALPWWRRSWWEWPMPARSAFASLAVISAALLVVFVLPLLTGWTTSTSASLASPWLNGAADYLKGLESLANAGAVVWRAAAQPVILGLLMVSSFLYLVCVGLGTMFVRLAWQRI
jgi:hypothetical protein